MANPPTKPKPADATNTPTAEAPTTEAPVAETPVQQPSVENETPEAKPRRSRRVKNDPRRLREQQQTASKPQKDSTQSTTPPAAPENGSELIESKAHTKDLKPADVDTPAPVSPKTNARPQMTEMAKAVAASHNLEKPAFAPVPPVLNTPTVDETPETSKAKVTESQADELPKQAPNVPVAQEEGSKAKSLETTEPVEPPFPTGKAEPTADTSQPMQAICEPQLRRRRSRAVIVMKEI